MNRTIAKEWNTKRNSLVTPDAVASGSSKSFWWVCDKGHEWKTTIHNRTHHHTGCPYCAGKKILPGFNDLATQHPELLQVWHPTENTVAPETLSSTSKKIVWWKEETCNHEYELSVFARLKAKKCQVCAGRVIVEGVNDLAFLRPDLAAEWHPTKNGELTPEHIGVGSNRKVWWVCDKGHEWNTPVYSRTSRNPTGCPYCARKQVYSGFNDLVTVNPVLAEEWHPSKNGELTPANVTAFSSRKVWWVCDKGHEWEATVNGRNQGRNCQKCFSVNHVSQPEKEIHDFLHDNDVPYIPNDRSLIAPQELDVFIPEKHVAIEFNGVYWHSEECGKDRHYHYNKWLECREKGVQLLQVWEDDWARNPELIKRMLAHKLGFSKQLRVYARKTHVVSVPIDEARSFLNEYHIQGFVSGSYYLGLRDGLGVLVAVMVFKRGSREGDDYSLTRYATSHMVVGGFTKLLKHAVEIFHMRRITTFSDHGVSDGSLYENNGFRADKELASDYMYVYHHQRYHKFGFRLKRFKDDPNFLYEEGLTEFELANLNGLPRVWDAGKTRWVYSVDV
jgi:hypothetical protein